MSASVDIKTEKVTGALSVPIQAVTTREKDADKKKAKARQVAEKEAEEEEIKKDLIEVVFIVRGDTVQMAEVKTGVQDDTYIQVTSGIQEGDEVVVAPYAAIARKLEQGGEVQVVKEEELYKKD